MCSIAESRYSKKHLQKDTKVIKIEARRGVIENHNSHAVIHLTNEEKHTIKKMVQWVKSVRVFRKGTRKTGWQDVRNLLLMSWEEKYEMLRNKKVK